MISDDVIMDSMEKEIGEKAVVTIAKRQPVASDLRENHRRPAHCLRPRTRRRSRQEQFQARCGHPGDGRSAQLARGLEHLSDLALAQLKEVLDVYTTRSAEKAKSIRDRDEEIDAIYTSLFRELLTYMMEDPRNITSCTHLSSAPRTSSASATTRPTSPRPSTT